MKYHILLRIIYQNVLKDMGPDILLYNPGKRKKIRTNVYIYSMVSTENYANYWKTIKKKI